MEEKEDNYDPISMSDLDSDKWIVEHDDPAFLWMSLGWIF